MEKHKDNTVELNLADMFWQFASNWKKALLFAIIAAVLAGGIRLAVGIINSKDSEYLEKMELNNAITAESYTVQVKAYENQIANLQLQIEKKEEASQNAIMLRIDPYNTYAKYVTFYINTGYQIMPEMTYQNPNYTNTVTNSYIDALTNMNLDEAVATAEEPDLTAQNPFPNGEYSLLTVSEQSGGGLIYITIKGDTQERVDAIFAAVKELIEERQNMLKDVVSDHTLNVLSETDEIIIDTNVRSLQNRFIEDYSELIETLKTKRIEYEALEEPVLSSVSSKALIIGAIKYGILGGIVGVILGFVIWGVIRCLRGRVNSVEELRQKYDAVMLAAIPKESAKRSKFDKKLMHHLGIRKRLTTQSGLELAAANINLYLPDEKDLLLIGTVEEEKLARLGGDLAALLPDKNVIIGGDVNISAKAVSAVEEGHTVICVEGLNESSYRFINHELDAISKAREQKTYFIVVG